MSSLQKARWGHIVCTLDNKIFVMGGSYDAATCEMLDLNNEDPQWIGIADMNIIHYYLLLLCILFISAISLQLLPHLKHLPHLLHLPDLQQLPHLPHH